MQFIILDNKKLIIFWSPKCGCSTLKTILANFFNIDYTKDKHIHCNKELKNKINKMDINKIDVYKNYDIVILIRNPYERLVSGFLDKYVRKEIKNLSNCTCFADFSKILANNPKKIDRHHFEKQTTGDGWIFYNELERPKIKYILDTSKVNDIAKILELNISEIKINFNRKKGTGDLRQMWSANYDQLRKLDNINYSEFYNDYIKKRVYNIYKDDFIFFNNNLDMNYTI